MVISRKRVNRKVESIAAEGQVIDLPPAWCFTIHCKYHGDIRFDFEPLRQNGRDNLAMHARNAVWSLRHEMVGVTLLGILQQLTTYFWPFLDEQEHHGECLTRLDQIDTTILRGFLAWLERQIAGVGPRKGQPLSLSAKKNAYSVLKAVLVNRIKQVPDCVSPALKFPKSPFPKINHLVPKREPYSKNEQDCIVAACNRDLRLIHEHGGEVLPAAQVLVLHLIVLAMATGRNFQGLLELQRTSLKPHPLDDREILVTEKRRCGFPQIASYRINAPERLANQEQVLTIPTTVGEHFRWLAEYTRPLTADAGKADQDCIFLWRVPYTGRHPRSTRQGKVNRLSQVDARNAIDDFITRHGLVDDHGERLQLNISRCRPTFGSNLYARTRDIRKVQRALGHASAETTARHYVSLPADAERDHIFVGQAMVGWVTNTQESQAQVICSPQLLPIKSREKSVT